MNEKDILVAIDPAHEESWMKALPEAVQMAKNRGAHLHLMGVVPDYGMAIVAAALPQGWEKHALEQAKASLEELGGSQVGEAVQWSTHVGHGDVASEILRIAEETGAGIIVMSSHPPAAIRQFVIGSQAERVVHHSPVSVLVVRS